MIDEEKTSPTFIYAKQNTVGISRMEGEENHKAYFVVRNPTPRDIVQSLCSLSSPGRPVFLESTPSEAKPVPLEKNTK